MKSRQAFADIGRLFKCVLPCYRNFLISYFAVRNGKTLSLYMLGYGKHFRPLFVAELMESASRTVGFPPRRDGHYL